MDKRLTTPHSQHTSLCTLWLAAGGGSALNWLGAESGRSVKRLSRPSTATKRGAMAATMQDVADQAGVSIATVSFVVNNTKRVTPQTRARIEQAMQDLGFRRNLVARALASRRTRIIALVLAALDHGIRGASSEFVVGAAGEASVSDYHLVVYPDDKVGGQLPAL